MKRKITIHLEMDHYNFSKLRSCDRALDDRNPTTRTSKKTGENTFRHSNNKSKNSECEFYKNGVVSAHCGFSKKTTSE